MSRGDPCVKAAQRAAMIFPGVVEQDQFALEKQQAMMEFPDDGYQEVFLTPDKGLRRARQIVQEMLREEGAEMTIPVKVT